MVKGGKEKMWPWRQTNEQPKSENRATQLHTGRWVSQIPINQIRVEATKRDVSDSKQIFRHIFLETFANLVFSPSCTASEIIKHTMQSKVWPQQYLLVCFREGVKKTFFFGRSFPNMGGWGCRFPNFWWHLPTTISQHKSSQMWGRGSQNPKPNPNCGWNLLYAFNNSQINKYIMPVIIAGTMFHIVLSAQMSKYNFKFHKIFVDI